MTCVSKSELASNSMLETSSDLSECSEWEDHSVQTEPSFNLKVARIAYKVVMVSPQYLFAGVGEMIGWACGGILGAGVGAFLGTYVGCAVSFGIEGISYLFMTRVLGKPFSLDPNFEKELKEEGMVKILKDRFKSACILSVECAAAAIVFTPVVNHIARPLVGRSHTGSIAFLAIALITAVHSTAAAFLAALGARKTYSYLAERGIVSRSPEHEFHRENIKEYVKDAIVVGLPGEALSLAVDMPFRGLRWLFASSKLSIISTMQNGGSATIGCSVGHGLAEASRSFKIKPKSFSIFRPSSKQEHLVSA